MATHPCLPFHGTCAEALGSPAEVLGGTELQRRRDRGLPDRSDLPDPPRSGRLLHGQMTIGDGLLIASDSPEGQGAAPRASASVMQTAPDAEPARTRFDALAAGGAVIVPFGPAAFAAGFDMLRDRSGSRRMIAAPRDN